MTVNAFVQLVNVSKRFEGDKKLVLDNLNLTINQGEFLTMLGPSGCGKTTTLRIIAGFESPTSGEVIIQDENVTLKDPNERCVNTVFQNYALFPHMNIYDNIAFGLRMKKVKSEEIDEKVKEMLKMVKMEEYINRMPSELSGGQKQRIAIARAIINNPKVLLLDEPLGALDLKLRKQMQFELKHLQKELGITFIFVTHDQEEALTMSDRIIVMNEGVVEQIGTPYEIYEKPATKFVADFIGEANILEAVVKGLKENQALLSINTGEEVLIENKDYEVNEKLFLAIRPEKLSLSNDEKKLMSLKVAYKEKVYTGVTQRTIVTLGSGQEIQVLESTEDNFDFENKTNVYVTWKQDNLVVMKS